MCSRFGVRFIGPNCIGAIHTKTGLYTPFIALPDAYRSGGVSVFAQSGGVGLTLGERLSFSGLGVNKLVSMGNKLNLDEADFLQFLLNDPDTQIVFFYLEDFKRGREFAEAAALQMLQELSGAQILGAFRGMPKADLETAAVILANISRLMQKFPQIRELDLNPVSFHDSGVGAVALDARVLLRIA